MLCESTPFKLLALASMIIALAAADSPATIGVIISSDDPTVTGALPAVETVTLRA